MEEIFSLDLQNIYHLMCLQEEMGFLICFLTAFALPSVISPGRGNVIVSNIDSSMWHKQVLWLEDSNSSIVSGIQEFHNRLHNNSLKLWNVYEYKYVLRPQTYA